MRPQATAWATRNFGACPVDLNRRMPLSVRGRLERLFGSSSEFGFEKLLEILDIVPAGTETDPEQVRDSFVPSCEFGIGQQNPVTFFSLLFQPGSVRAPHNRQVEGSSPSGPTIYLAIHRCRFS